MTTKPLAPLTTEALTAPGKRPWAGYLLWIAAAGVLGFAIAAVFAGLLHWPRNIYLVPYVGLVGLFLYGFARWSGTSILDLVRHKWIWGLVGGVLLGFWTVGNILSQPASSRSEGLSLAFDLLWVGVAYGLVDGLLLAVLPVFAAWRAFSGLGWTAHGWDKIAAGLVGMLANLFVTVAYHLGYPECRVAGGLFGPLLGNAAMALGYIVSGNPIAATVSHIAMHIAGVLQGPASVLQLPPHY